MSVTYDHPFDMPLEYTLNLDFTSLAGNPGSRLTVELGARSARWLVGDDPTNPEVIIPLTLNVVNGLFLPVIAK